MSGQFCRWGVGCHCSTLAIRPCSSNRNTSKSSLSDALRSEAKSSSCRLSALTHTRSQHQDLSPYSASHLRLGKGFASLDYHCSQAIWLALSLVSYSPHNGRILSHNMWDPEIIIRHVQSQWHDCTCGPAPMHSRGFSHTDVMFCCSFPPTFL